ncbi:beta-lactamase/D-alanine carboxypeptidase [Paraburkholderia hospita]|uniref:Beta-lactamase n=1 Tax=Paraburkholderia hospita TaxID=169430 RepID=A0ABP2PP73_9BURK|nr:class C beta-lactamase [Paraburkholderia hospita]EIM99429.1 beta-lactamase/D-alanine carboxypeptidase [Paraburkholderia hospita]OUL73655.1 class C beta-lactamase [Paraburkholderia hospita]
MKFGTVSARVAAMLCAMWMTSGASHAADATQDNLKRAVDAAIQPLMTKDKIPGMAVGVIVDGRAVVFNYGVASTETGKPVTDATLFELGSVSKTFTATLTSWAQVDKQLSLTDSVAKYLPTLRGTQFGSVSLLNLGTHTPGGLPLQVPDDIQNDDQMIRWFKAWRPAHAPGTVRTYANPGIGALGMITAKSMGQDFTALIERRLFPALGLKNSFIDVPVDRAPDYAQGYTKTGQPIRMAGGEFAPQAYGVKSTATDMLRFVEANMKQVELDAQLQRAITDTHTGYFQAGPMTQDLIWEQYPYPVALNSLMEGNAPAMALDATPVTKIEPPEAPNDNVWINKTGSTNGFGSYVAFVPQKHMGIVILGNRNFPILDRVAAAHRILTSLEQP